MAVSRSIGSIPCQLGQLYPHHRSSWRSPTVSLLNTVGGQVTITVPGAAGNTSTAINIWGYAL
jgi:hypothetical protein